MLMAHIEYIVNGKTLQIPIMVDAVTYLENNEQIFNSATELTSQTVAGFYHSNSMGGNVVLSVPSQPLFVNRCKVTLFKIVREGDILTFGSTEFHFHEISKAILTSESDSVVQQQRCTICRKLFKAGDEVVYCPKCNRMYHQHCWAYQKGRCPNRFCQYQALWNEPDKLTENQQAS
jgi:hypothetical protein